MRPLSRREMAVDRVPAGSVVGLAEENSLVSAESGCAPAAGLPEAATTAERSGSGDDRRARDARSADGTERPVCPGNRASMADRWLPVLVGLPGIDRWLRVCGTVAQLGCGSGELVIELALAYPNSWFAGYDSDPQCVEQARDDAAGVGVAESTRFEATFGGELPGSGYDLIIVPACLGAGPDLFVAYRQALAADGVLAITALDGPDGYRAVLGDPGPAESVSVSAVDRLAVAAGFTRCRRIVVDGVGVLFDIRS